jgi:hypothetical protein
VPFRGIWKGESAERSQEGDFESGKGGRNQLCGAPCGLFATGSRPLFPEQFKALEIGEERRIPAAAIFRQRRFGRDRHVNVRTVHVPADSAGFQPFSGDAVAISAGFQANWLKSDSAVCHVDVNLESFLVFDQQTHHLFVVIQALNGCRQNLLNHAGPCHFTQSQVRDS